MSHCLSSAASETCERKNVSKVARPRGLSSAAPAHLLYEPVAPLVVRRRFVPGFRVRVRSPRARLLLDGGGGVAQEERGRSVHEGLPPSAPAPVPPVPKQGTRPRSRSPLPRPLLAIRALEVGLRSGRGRLRRRAPPRPRARARPGSRLAQSSLHRETPCRPSSRRDLPPSSFRAPGKARSTRRLTPVVSTTKKNEKGQEKGQE